MTEPCSDIESDANADAIAAAIDEAEEPSQGFLGPITKDAPSVTPIGHSGGNYYFISADGERRQLTAREMVRLNLASLFGGDTLWLCCNFPVYNKQKERIENVFNANHAAEWMMRQCSRAGLYNSATPLRRLGVWRAGAHVVVHLGSNIWYRGEVKKSGSIVAGAIYPACPSLEEPAFDTPADRFDALRVRQTLNAWSFTQEHDADLLFGFLGAALLGGFPQWRVHALVTGEGGSGKSTICRYLMDLIGAQGTNSNDYSEAGLRQMLADMARLVHLDEGENSGEEQVHRMAKIVALLRKMSDGTGAHIVRGTSGGSVISTTVTGSVLISAINAPPLQPQDRSRILVVPIAKPSGDTSPEDIRAFRREAAALSPRLRARALLGADRFEGAFDIYRRSLRKHGCDDRRADFFATLMAGRSLLMDDELPKEEAAVAYVTTMRDRLRLIMVDDSDTSDGKSCLNRLLDAECAAIRDGVKRSIGMLVQDAMGAGAAPENEKLMPLGLRIMDRRGTPERERMLFIANDHFGLKRIFHNTPWADGNWRASLMRLPGVKPSPVPIAVGRKSRGVLIPQDLLPTTDVYSDNDVDMPPHPPDPVP